MVSLNARALAQPAAQQHSVHNTVQEPAVSAKPSRAVARDSMQRGGAVYGGAPPTPTAVHWWQDPKLTFGPPGDPEFLGRQLGIDQVRLALPRRGTKVTD